VRVRLFTGVALAIGAATLLYATGCGSRSSTLPVASQPVAVMGDSESEVLSSARSARSAGRHPVYLTVKAAIKDYTFPVYAQALRTASSVIVRSWGNGYVFPSSAVRLAYGDAQSAVDVGQLPLVQAPLIDAAIAKGAQPGKFLEGAVGLKRSLCPDCITVYANPIWVRAIASQWNGIKDPWQLTANYTPWTSPGGTSSRKVADILIQNCNPVQTNFNLDGLTFAVQMSSNCSAGYIIPSDTGGGSVGGGGGPTGGGGQVAALPPGFPGDKCTFPGAPDSAAIGLPLSGVDQPGPNGNEVNNVFHIFTPAATTGGIAFFL